MYRSFHINIFSNKISCVLSVILCLTILYFYFSTQERCDISNPLPLPLIAKREDFVKILNAENFRSAAEVGVQQGAYAHYLLSKWPQCTEYHAIAIWKLQHSYLDVANIPDVKQQEFYDEIRNKLKPWGNIVRYHRNFSSFAAYEIKDNSLDFIYIDARHDYVGATEDMELWWNKLKCGGVFAGHDYLDTHAVSGQNWESDLKVLRDTDTVSVKSAVLHFATKKNRSVLITTQDSWPSWYFRK